MKKEVVIELTIEEMLDELEFLIYEKGVTKLRVTEDFTINGKHTYDVECLRMELEGNSVCCSDDTDIMNKSYCVMMTFLKRCVLSIKKIYVDRIPHGEIEFTDGIILIEGTEII